MSYHDIKRADVKRFLIKVINRDGPSTVKYLHGKVNYERKISASMNYIRQCLREMEQIGATGNEKMVEGIKAGRSTYYDSCRKWKDFK